MAIARRRFAHLHMFIMAWLTSCSATETCEFRKHQRTGCKQITCDTLNYQDSALKKGVTLA
ncbi:hypothetical protein PGT21_013147 [Puccinia graminis f. sp. tritici]|uniref:Uncharacterized protein n=1 Tax=Puccinia graminis f. sp. tritici TaxID=56615 RepID=A0A5B0N5C3_PUCGR|nr:hypothetical protein PGTUg99_029523 [Puccinia graminis f. sp. tritici]KAA1094166.1 hypothetical protein PGT21_012010 [Puccinia graminis f. sp. tritici]KAA1108445.1 hypothetical protein PGT21_013147 [Puccinia graminis f. sp. tritici]KAA1138610.1 hypothetical protein PGTUg99_031035 [Puccinia graminis f. sp. tritici]